MEKQFPKCFLAASSCEGFVSHFGESFAPYDGWRAIIIKGGPGTGKSSFMKYIAAKATDRGYNITLCVCSSDPDSLDGIIIEDIKKVILDGTSPHVVEPKYPGVCEEILNLGQFWDANKLTKRADEILHLTDENKAIHKTVSRYLSAAGVLMRDNLKICAGYIDIKKATVFAEKLAHRYIPDKEGKEGKEWLRFIGGITPKGVVSYVDTINKFCTNRVIIEDKLGVVSGIIMQKIRARALKDGYEIITFKNPFLPSLLTDHIIIPELSLCFVTENEYINFGGNERRIHARRFADIKKLHAARSRILFNRRVIRELLLTSAATLKKAKLVHDDLEKIYIESMDFDAVSRFAIKKAEEILQDN